MIHGRNPLSGPVVAVVIGFVVVCVGALLPLSVA